VDAVKVVADGGDDDIDGVVLTAFERAVAEAPVRG
jgi:hypothetical protein